MQAVEAFRRTRMLDTATSDDDQPVSIYKLDEICDLCKSSGPDIVTGIVEHLVKRLDHKSPYVKQKVLRLVKYCAPGKAGADFKREIQRHSGSIRALYQYRGAPDALKGDALNKAVRDMAHEAIQAMFSTDSAARGAGDEFRLHPHKRMEGFGSSPPPSHRPHEDKGIAGMLTSGVKNLQDLVKTSGGVEGAMKAVVGQYLGGSRSRPFSQYSSDNTGDRGSFRPPREEPSWSSYDRGEDRGYGGGDAYGVERDPHRRLQGSSDDGIGAASMDAAPVVHPKCVQTEEKRVVDTVTAPGGVRAMPSREVLQQFLASAATLDGKEVAALLDAKLRETSWQVRLRALCALEAIHRHGAQGNLAVVLDFFQRDPASITDCLSFPQATLRERATKVLRAMGLFDSEPEPEPAATKHETSNGVEPSDVIDSSGPDLLSMDDPIPSKSPASAQSAAASPAPPTSNQGPSAPGDPLSVPAHALIADVPLVPAKGSASGAVDPFGIDAWAQPAGEELLAGMTVASSEQPSQGTGAVLSTSEHAGGDSVGPGLFAGMDVAATDGLGEVGTSRAATPPVAAMAPPVGAMDPLPGAVSPHSAMMAGESLGNSHTSLLPVDPFVSVPTVLPELSSAPGGVANSQQAGSVTDNLQGLSVSQSQQPRTSVSNTAKPSETFKAAPGPAKAPVREALPPMPIAEFATRGGGQGPSVPPSGGPIPQMMQMPMQMGMQIPPYMIQQQMAYFQAAMAAASRGGPSGPVMVPPGAFSYMAATPGVGQMNGGTTFAQQPAGLQPLLGAGQGSFQSTGFASVTGGLAGSGAALARTASGGFSSGLGSPTGANSDPFLAAGMVHSDFQENKAELKAFDFVLDHMKASKPGTSKPAKMQPMKS